MSQRRINGQGTRPYVWNDSVRRTRAAGNRMSASARAAREAKLRKERQKRIHPSFFMWK